MVRLTAGEKRTFIFRANAGSSCLKSLATAAVLRSLLNRVLRITCTKLINTQLIR